MNDHELLILAAKAAGMDVQRSRLDDPINKDFLMNGNGVRNEGQRSFPWNPLADDGDALRLAAQLSMSVEISAHEETTYAYAGVQPRVYGFENWRGDKKKATRRAIVLAASEIGKAMP